MDHLVYSYSLKTLIWRDTSDLRRNWNVVGQTGIQLFTCEILLLIKYRSQNKLFKLDFDSTAAGITEFNSQFSINLNVGTTIYMQLT